MFENRFHCDIGIFIPLLLPFFKFYLSSKKCVLFFIFSIEISHYNQQKIVMGEIDKLFVTLHPDILILNKQILNKIKDVSKMTFGGKTIL
jgi:hypothetical protein